MHRLNTPRKQPLWVLPPSLQTNGSAMKNNVHAVIGQFVSSSLDETNINAKTLVVSRCQDMFLLEQFLWEIILGN